MRLSEDAKDISRVVVKTLIATLAAHLTQKAALRAVEEVETRVYRFKKARKGPVGFRR